MKRSVTLFAVWLAVILSSLAFPAGAQEYPYPVFENDCPSQLAPLLDSLIPDGGRANPRLSCWIMWVPENYAQPNGPYIALSFYRIRSRSTSVQSDPIFYLPGGPGGTGYFALQFFFRTTLGLTGDRDLQGPRDMIVIDPRGNFPLQTAVANPTSECPEMYTAAFDILSRTDRSASQEYAVWAAGTRACLTRLRAAGWNLDHYNTPAIVRDVEEIRRTMGFQQINLFSESYGTLHALEYMRRYPSRVRVSVLDSITSFTRPYESRIGLIEPGSASLNRLLNTCEADANCNTRYPQFRTQLFNTLWRLESSPYVTQVVNDYTGRSETVRITGQRLLGLLIGALYRSDLIPLIPGAVKAIDEFGNFELIEQFKFKLQSYADGGYGMKAATVCSDFGRIGVLDSPAEIEALPNLWRNYGLKANVPCDAVGVAPAPVGFNTPVNSAVTSLVIAGRWDPITPVSDSADAAARLSNSRLVVFDHQSHVPVRRNACAQQIASNFFIGGLFTSVSCVANEPPLRFR